jgi:hypothetical protein
MIHPTDERDRPQTPSLVELLGLPGSGKTHIARSVVDALTRGGTSAFLGPVGVGPEDPPARRIARKVSMLGMRALMRPIHSTRAAAAICVGQHAPADAMSRTLQWLVTQHALERAGRIDGLHVFDEGSLQALWSIGLRSDRDRWRRLLADLAAGRLTWVEPDIVVLVDAPRDVVSERLSTRTSAHSRTQRLSAAEMAAELRRGENLLDELATWWRVRRGDDALVHVYNGRDGPVGLDDVAARFAA